VKLALLLDPFADTKSQPVERSLWRLKPSDLASLQMASHLRESGVVTEVWALSVAATEVDLTGTLRYCLSLGIDRAIKVISDVDQCWNKRGVSTAIKVIIESLQPDLIFCGSTAVGTCPVGSLLAGMCGCPFVGGAVELRCTRNQRVIVSRCLGGGYRELIEAELPVVIGIDARLSRPSVYGSVQLIRKAMRASIDELPVELGSTVEVNHPPASWGAFP